MISQKLQENLSNSKSFTVTFDLYVCIKSKVPQPKKIVNAQTGRHETHLTNKLYLVGIIEIYLPSHMLPRSLPAFLLAELARFTHFDHPSGKKATLLIFSVFD